MKRYTKLGVWLLILAMLIGCMAGCGSQTTESSTEPEAATSAETSETTTTESASAAEAETTAEDSSAAEESAAPAAAEAADDGADAETEAAAEEDSTLAYFPLDESEEITIWMSYPPIFEGLADNGPADFAMYQEVQERTNVQLTFHSASYITAAETFNLMLAGGDYDDVLWSMFSYYTSSVDTAIENDLIIDLTDYVADYMPNYTSYIDSDPETYRMALTTDAGNMGYISMLDSEGTVSGGFAIRADWLEQIGMEAPVTIEDYEAVLTAFQTELGVANPLFMASTGFYRYSYLGSAFDISIDFTNTDGVGMPYYVIDGTVSFSPLDGSYKEYLELVHSWYELGFFNSDFVSSEGTSNQNEIDDSKIFNNEVGIFLSRANSINYEEYTTLEEGFQVEPISSPRAYEDQTLHFIQVSSPVSAIASAVVTTACDPDKYETLFRFFDYFYTDEGIMLVNYGIEGESYTLDENGDPHYTEVVTNNDTYNQDVLISYYTGGGTLNLGVKLASTYAELYTDRQYEAMEYWSTDNADTDYMLPYQVSIPLDDQDDYNAKWNDVLARLQEQTLKFILGDRDLSEYDDFVEELKTLGAEQCLEYMQEAYDNYMAR